MTKPEEIKQEDLVKTILSAAKGKITGRIRMQKIVYFLEQLGMGGEFRFSYHHYGPYSEELSSAIDMAKMLDKTVQEKEFPIEGGFYSVFTLNPSDECAPATLGSLPWSRAQECISAMKAETSVVIELAATIHWLWEKEHVHDGWRKELKIRKPSKADDARIDKALVLLRTLNPDWQRSEGVPVQRIEAIGN